VIRELDAIRREVPTFAWYHDPDLAPLLAADGMAAVRARYPKGD
jgi:hypothetical protein